LEKYELDIKAVTKGRDCYVCETDRGTMLLKEYIRSAERAEFLSKMLLHIQSCGVISEQIIRNSEGEILSEGEDGNMYMLVTSVRGAECDTHDRDDIVAAARLLADLHIAASSYEGDVPQAFFAGEHDQLEICEKHNRELLKVRNYIRNKKKKNEFEQLFIHHYDGFMEKALHVAEHIKENQEPPCTRIGFCHGDYNQHNVIFTANGVAAVHLDGFVYREQISDLAYFMRKILEKNNWNVGLGLDMIRAYGKLIPIGNDEMALLYGYIAYPEKFWKVANRYYNSHKAWLSGRNIEKLTKVIEQEPVREHFMEMVFNGNILHGNILNS
jgi:CotS family spore coat protein